MWHSLEYSLNFVRIIFFCYVLQQITGKEENLIPLIVLISPDIEVVERVITNQDKLAFFLVGTSIFCLNRDIWMVGYAFWAILINA